MEYTQIIPAFYNGIYSFRKLQWIQNYRKKLHDSRWVPSAVVMATHVSPLATAAGTLRRHLSSHSL